MDALVQDLRYAVASMRRNRAFAAAALSTLAVGIGATTAVFSVVYGVLLRPLPYPDSNRLVRLSEEHAGAISPLPEPMLSNLTYYAWSANSRTVEAFAAYRGQPLTFALPGGASRVGGTAVTTSLFPLLGAAPALGRFFRAEEGSEAAAAVMVLSDRLWRENFGADPAVVGRGVEADGSPYTIIGVAPPGFDFPDGETRFWTALAVRRPTPDAVAGQRGQVSVVNAIARLRPGVSPLAAAAEGTAAARATVRPMAATLLFGVGGAPVVHARGIVDEMTARVRPALLVLVAGVLCLLLIACANVSSMFLSRGVARERELTIRAAIGASRGRLARQMLTESMVVAVVGGGLGVGLAFALVAVVPASGSTSLPRVNSVTIDARALVVAAAAALFAGAVSGLGPIGRASRFNLVASPPGDGAAAGGFRDPRARALRDLLLGAEAAVAAILVVGAVLMARSFVRLATVDAGYTADHVLATEVFVPGGDSDARAAVANRLVAGLTERIRSMPGVVAAGAGNMAPLDNTTRLSAFLAPWAPNGAAPPRVRTISYVVTPGYAEALGLRLRAGRFFTSDDRAGGMSPWIVNEEFARLYLPPRPVGYQFVWGAASDGSLPARTNV